MSKYWSKLHQQIIETSLILIWRGKHGLVSTAYTCMNNYFMGYLYHCRKIIYHLRYTNFCKSAVSPVWKSACSQLCPVETMMRKRWKHPAFPRNYLHDCSLQLALFPGSPLAPTKNKNGGGEPGIDSHVISRHVDITAIIAKIVTKLCSHVMGWFEQLRYLLLKKVSCNFVGETTARFEQQRRLSIQCLVKNRLFTVAIFRFEKYH